MVMLKKLNKLEIEKVVFKYWKSIFLFGLLSAFLTALIMYSWPKKFDAFVLIQPATIGIQTGVAKGTEVETPADMAQRLSFGSFYSQYVLDACGYSDDETSRAKLISLVKVVPVKSTLVAKVSYSDQDPSRAENCLAGILEEIKKTESEISDQLLTKTREYDLWAKNQLEEARKIRAILEKQVESSAANDKALMLATLKLNILMLKSQEIERIEKWSQSLTALLAPPLTQPAKVLQPITIKDSFSFWRRTAMVFVGFFIGFIMAIFFRIFYQARPLLK